MLPSWGKGSSVGVTYKMCIRDRAITFMGALNTGDGYVKGTNYEGWTYFGNISKVIIDHYKLSLAAFGSPQRHNQRSTMHYIDDYKNSPDGGRFNNGYGYILSLIHIFGPPCVWPPD